MLFELGSKGVFIGLPVCVTKYSDLQSWSKVVGTMLTEYEITSYCFTSRLSLTLWLAMMSPLPPNQCWCELVVITYSYCVRLIFQHLFGEGGKLVSSQHFWPWLYLYVVLDSIMNQELWNLKRKCKRKHETWREWGLHLTPSSLPMTLWKNRCGIVMKCDIHSVKGLMLKILSINIFLTASHFPFQLVVGNPLNLTFTLMKD